MTPKIAFSFFLLLVLVNLCPDAKAESRPYEAEVELMCKATLPKTANVGDLSVCKNALGVCLVTHIKERGIELTEDSIPDIAEACFDLQYQAAVKHAKWSKKSGLNATQKKMTTGVITIEEALKDKVFKMEAGCRVASKKEGYTNYVKMHECVQANQ